MRLGAISWLPTCPDAWKLLRPAFKTLILPFARLLARFATKVSLGGMRMKVAKEGATASTVRNPFTTSKGYLI
jgi:hypothetical protein